MNRFLRVLLAGVCLLFCVVARADEPKRETQGITQIVVQRTQCEGTCPVDSLTFNADGSATYSGFGPSPRRGFFKGNLSRDKFAALETFLQNQNFFELKPEIGMGNIDLPDFVVSVTRDHLTYCVVVRAGSSPALQKKLSEALLVSDQIQWQRDDLISESGVRGTVSRPLTPRETRLFSDRPNIKLLQMKFAPVELQSLDHPEVRIQTRTDQEGQFQFFAAPGRYSVRFSDANHSRNFLDQRPFYTGEAQTIEVKPKTFAALTLNFVSSGI